ncbi:hypothetical protein MLD38_037650 [Melastoma candidum]|uniref:Uncharacterized protein n=1 Tax=Melastoma candidum TaxID=119954 RepID=A0ACB9LQ19_9MYRT|nr:hypothetical protein MLD38_037650 [Melastoma candidum]
MEARWWDIVSPLPPSDADHSGAVPRDKLSQLVETFAGHNLVVAGVVTHVVDLQPNGIQEDSANEVDSGALHLNDAVDADSEQGGEEIALHLEPDSIALHTAVMVVEQQILGHVGPSWTIFNEKLGMALLLRVADGS